MVEEMNLCRVERESELSGAGESASTCVCKCSGRTTAPMVQIREPLFRGGFGEPTRTATPHCRSARSNSVDPTTAAALVERISLAIEPPLVESSRS